MPTVRVITLGCKVNQCDGEEIARELQARGYSPAARGAADVYVVNTCTVTSIADAKARKLIHKLARERPEAVLVVTGCYAERDLEALAAIPGVDAVVGNGRKGDIPAIVADLVAGCGSQDLRSQISDGRSSAPAQRVRAFVKIQDGCDHRCAYCVVPAVRGRPASKPMEEVLQEIEALATAGAPEVVLCGIRLGAYGRDLGNGSLAVLLREVRHTRIPRVRLSSLEPMDVSDELIAEIADHPRLCRHLHLPMQSGDDQVLAEMGRGYTSGGFASLVGKLRGAWPEVAISADVMVGFPGETEEQFERTVGFVQEIGFSHLHVFPFSARPGTPAAERRDQVSASARRARAERTLGVGEELAQNAAQAWVGREVSVLFEERRSDGLLAGWTEHYIRARCEGPEEWIGRIVSVLPRAARQGELLA
jgi:threonylcarbamoyladenosine tRNA methylthiotransferase MtaB